METTHLPIYNKTKSKQSNSIIRYIIASALIIGLYCFRTKISNGSDLRSSINLQGPHNPDSLCPLVKKIDPTEYLYNTQTLKKILSDESFRNDSIRKLSKAVQYDTQVYDDMINPAAADTLEELYKLEPSWRSFESFHGYLESAFPLVHEKLKVEKVNKFGLVYTWKGSSDKKPILLTAHMDVVPVDKETLDQWTYPPFEGKYDGEFIFGRGVSDCKDLLIGLLETIELLLEESEFTPKRTIVLAFGYDEESEGTGALGIAKHLLARYGPDSFFQLIDEGDSGYETIEGTNFILPATGEKGHLNSVIDLFTPGGHSSVPPAHTSIGLISKLIELIENSQYDSILTNANPVLNQLQCVAEHSTTIEKGLKSNILKAHIDANANQKVIEYLSRSGEGKYLITTSQAADIIQGGVKSNALPEHVSVLVNQRIAIEESVQSTSEKILKDIKTIAEKFDLGVTYNGHVIKKHTENGYFNYTLKSTIEPAPITPATGGVWEAFGGSLRYLYEDLIYPNLNDIFIFAPFISTGNTDTRAYWDLTRNIYRYAPGIPYPSNIHSVDEKLLFDSHLSIVAFYYYYIQVTDALDLDD